jgi:hypothetical protein
LHESHHFSNNDEAEKQVCNYQHGAIKCIIFLGWIFRSNDPHLPSWPTRIELKFTHNHPISSVSSLAYRDVDQSVRDKLVEMFKDGNSPSSALNLLKYDLQIEHGDNYPFIAADRKFCPDLKYCFRYNSQHKICSVTNSPSFVLF